MFFPLRAIDGMRAENDRRSLRADPSETPERRRGAMHNLTLLHATEFLRLHHRLLDGDVDAEEVLASLLLHECPRNVWQRLRRTVWPAR
jgi:hypothetical protein